MKRAILTLVLFSHTFAQAAPCYWSLDANLPQIDPQKVSAAILAEANAPSGIPGETRKEIAHLSPAPSSGGNTVPPLGISLRQNYIQARLKDPNVEVQAFVLDATPWETFDIQPSDIRVAPNIPGIVVLGGAAALIVTGASPLLGAGILAFAAAPLIPFLGYHLVAKPNAPIFPYKSIDREVRKVAGTLRTGEWAYVGLSNGDVLPNILPGESDYFKWLIGIGLTSDLVNALKTGYIAPLEQNYGSGRFTVDLLIKRTGFRAMRVYGILTRETQ